MILKGEFKNLKPLVSKLCTFALKVPGNNRNKKLLTGGRETKKQSPGLYKHTPYETPIKCFYTKPA
jgi:hypothetical protein